MTTQEVCIVSVGITFRNLEVCDNTCFEKYLFYVVMTVTVINGDKRIFNRHCQDDALVLINFSINPWTVLKWNKFLSSQMYVQASVVHDGSRF